MDAVVLAGGLGTRLRARLPDRPKPMAPVLGRPFLEFALRQLTAQGVERVVLCVGHLGEQIGDHFGDSFEGLELIYSIEDRPLGTGGAIKQALTLAGLDQCLVLNGDTYVKLDVAELRRASSAPDHEGLVMTVVEVQDVTRYGSVEIDGSRIVQLNEKGDRGAGHINAGAYLISDSFARELAGLPDAFSFESELLTPWVAQRGCAYVKSRGPFIDIGVPDDLDRAAALLSAV